MAVLITDPTLLLSGNDDAATTPGAELTIDTTAKTITINPGSGDLDATVGGVTGQALYSALKILWKNSSTYIKFPPPMEMITPEQFEFINGWVPADATTRKAIRTAGWVERNASGNITKMFAGIISLGDMGSSDQPYYQQVNATTASANFTFTGKVNEAIQILDDPNGDGTYSDGYDRRSYLKLFVREYQKSYASAQLSDIGVDGNMTYIVYRFPLANASDLKITQNDTNVSTNSPFTGVDITYYGSNQNRSIGGTNYPFRIIIDGNNATAEQIYMKVQYLLRQNSDIDEGAGTVTGKTADALLRFVGDTLVTSQGVYIDNFNSNDTNRLEFFDQNNVKRVFPFVAAGTLNFGTNAVSDTNAIYRLFFETNPGGNFGTANAIIVNDSSGNAISGNVGGNSSVSFSFAYDSNTQGGRTAGTDASVRLVVIGLNTSQYASATATISRSTGQSISITPSLERNYTNA